MAIRTYKWFAAVSDEQRLRALLAVLAVGEVLQKDLASELGLSQPTVSRAVTALRDVGLLERGNQRMPLTVPRPRETRTLIRAAALIEHAHTGNPDALKLATELQRQDMARGAGEPEPINPPPDDGGPAAGASDSDA